MWKKAFKLRVLVFVEYESEVEEEQARVKALLEKLRVEAEVHVFWLARGDLKTYEFIINGRCDDLSSEVMVNDILRHEEWWDELQRYRGRSASMSSSQELNSLATILDATAGRPGVYNPHGGGEDAEARRRPSVVDLLDMHAKPTMSKLSRLGVNVGIHTQHLADEVFDDQFRQMDNIDTADNSDVSESTSDSELDLESDSETSERGGDVDVDGSEAAKRPLLGGALTRRSQADTEYIGSKSGLKPGARGIRSGGAEPSAHSYGTMSSRTLTEIEEQPLQEPSSSKTGENSTAPVGKQTPPPPSTPPLSPGPVTRPPPGPEPHASPQQQTSPSAQLRRLDMPTVGKDTSFPDLQIQQQQRQPLVDATSSVSVRPTLSRQSSAVRFSSKPMPETMTNVEDTAGPTIMFAESTVETQTASSPRLELPSFSRQSSAGRFSSRPMPGTKITSDETGPRISFADPIHHSRNSLTYSNIGHGTSLNMPEIVESYRRNASGGDDGFPYSTQNVSLSFNDLPSRAQHIILNELMRKNSQEAAVLMSTLPIPAEGTNSSEEATLMYLSDIEVLCNELPPILLVLSNGMTVTVGL
jgi:potassium/chloride transporter 9